MAVPDSETLSQGEVESALQADHNEQQSMNHPFASLGRQSSIYSLTLDEFQHTLCESGKNFGSMNMDEFLTSIWNAEENQTINSATADSDNNNSATSINPTHLPLKETSSTAVHRGLVKQPSLARQGSLTLPAQLCAKTVDEVWSEIHGGSQQGQHQQQQNCGNENDTKSTDHNSAVQDPETATLQPTFGEMTLEDFLIKAGVVREQDPTPPPAAQPSLQQHFEICQTKNNKAVMGSKFDARHVLGLGGSITAAPAYQPIPPAVGVIATDQSSAYRESDEERAGGYSVPQAVPPVQPHPTPAACYGGRVGNGGGYPGVVPTMSPVSPAAVGKNHQVDQTGGIRKKRMTVGPVEKGVERRQRRMIKNRESAARSRARKQAYTVELEAELNQLKEENVHLMQELAEMENKRNQEYVQELKIKPYTKAKTAEEKLRVMRRNSSCPL